MYRIKDLTFDFDRFVSAEAIRAEASGYFLLLGGAFPPGFQVVSADEGYRVFGRGNPNLDMPDQLTPEDLQIPEGCGGQGMADYLHVEDTPVGYEPPFGPSVRVTIGYNERETLQPANLNYTQLWASMDPQLEWLYHDHHANRGDGGDSRRRQRRSSHQSVGPELQLRPSQHHPWFPMGERPH
jgi:hypothetical protein